MGLLIKVFCLNTDRLTDKTRQTDEQTDEQTDNPTDLQQGLGDFGETNCILRLLIKIVCCMTDQHTD